MQESTQPGTNAAEPDSPSASDFEECWLDLKIPRQYFYPIHWAPTHPEFPRPSNHPFSLQFHYQTPRIFVCYFLENIYILIQLTYLILLTKFCSDISLNPESDLKRGIGVEQLEDGFFLALSEDNTGLLLPPDLTLSRRLPVPILPCNSFNNVADGVSLADFYKEEKLIHLLTSEHLCTSWAARFRLCDESIFR